MTAAALLLGLRLLLALTLYAFLSAILIYLRRDIRASDRQEQPIPASWLVLESEEETKRIFRLREVNSLGRAIDNTILLEDETVSTHHARLSFQGGQWWMEDLGSSNGSSVNDIPVSAPLVVTFGDHIKLGGLDLRLAPGGVNDDGPGIG